MRNICAVVPALLPACFAHVCVMWHSCCRLNLAACWLTSTRQEEVCLPVACFFFVEGFVRRPTVLAPVPAFAALCVTSACSRSNFCSHTYLRNDGVFVGVMIVRFVLLCKCILPPSRAALAVPPSWMLDIYVRWQTLLPIGRIIMCVWC